MKRIVIVLGTLAAVAALALGAVTLGGKVTSAQEDGSPVTVFIAKVAEKLGVSEDELTAAMKEARLEMIDEAVAQGRISEELAERLREQVEAGHLFPLRPPERHPGPERCQRIVHFIAGAAAQVLGMEKEALVEELKAGKSLAQIAEAQGMGVEEFTQALLEQIKVQLDELVAAGKLTPEQAERLFQKAQQHIHRIVNAHLPPGGPCRPHGPGSRPPVVPPPFDGE